MTVEFQVATRVTVEPTTRYNEDTEAYEIIESDQPATEAFSTVSFEPETVREFYSRSRKDPSLTGTHIVFQNRGTRGYDVTASYEEVKAVMSNAGLLMFEFDATLRVHDEYAPGQGEPTYKVSVNPKAVLGFHARNPYNDGTPRNGTRIVYKAQDYARPITNSFDDVTVQMGPYVESLPQIEDDSDYDELDEEVDAEFEANEDGGQGRLN
jgi:hypothetical protein